jgi:glycosyltransferase involved in cell wall biosynthesis
MVEAMACGTPVFALPGGSVPEVVRPGISGAISFSAEEMADAVRNATFRPEVVRGWVEQRFSVDIMVQRYIALYEGILGNRLDSGSRLDLAKVIAA